MAFLGKKKKRKKLKLIQITTLKAINGQGQMQRNKKSDVFMEKQQMNSQRKQ